MDVTDWEFYLEASCDNCDHDFSGDVMGWMGWSEHGADWDCPECGHHNEWSGGYGWSELREEDKYE